MTNQINKNLSGNCLCGLITYEVTKLENCIGHCHCSMCRKFHGAAFATLGAAKTMNFRWATGERHLKSYVASNGTTRKFCENCGSSLIFVPPGDCGALVEFSLGTLDSDIEAKPDAHIYTKFSATWYEINEKLPHYAEGRGSKMLNDSNE